MRPGLGPRVLGESAAEEVSGEGSEEAVGPLAARWQPSEVGLFTRLWPSQGSEVLPGLHSSLAWG